MKPSPIRGVSISYSVLIEKLCEAFGDAACRRFTDMFDKNYGTPSRGGAAIMVFVDRNFYEDLAYDCECGRIDPEVGQWVQQTLMGCFNDIDAECYIAC
jgi:hypothetical protein